MKHFKTPDGTVYAFEADGSQDARITEQMVPLSDEELVTLRAPAPLTKDQQIAVLLADKGVSRVMVQTVIVASEAYAAAKLIALPALYTSNKTYRMAKDLEAAIIALEKAP